MWKDWIKPFVRPLPQWSTVAVAAPQTVVRAVLRASGESVDVTHDHTVASLKPLVIASSVDAGDEAMLDYRDAATDELIGSLHLRRREELIAQDERVVLYDVLRGGHRCLAGPRRSWNAWLQNRAMRRHPSGHHALMAPQAVQQLMVAYLCPRPVVLVSVATLEHRNLFPMDLIGPLQRSGLYALALRSTNVSAATMRASGRVALSHVDASMKAEAYRLSEHHRQPVDEWSALPFAMRPSEVFGIPVVAEALRVDELGVVHSQEIGSHTLFLCRVVSQVDRAQGAQLHHTAGFYQAYRRRRGEGLVEV